MHEAVSQQINQFAIHGNKEIFIARFLRKIMSEPLVFADIWLQTKSNIKLAYCFNSATSCHVPVSGATSW